MKERGDLLTENIMFIILNLAFISIILLFLFSRLSGAGVLEEQYSKKIALAIDSSDFDLTVIKIDMQDALKKAEKNNFPRDKIVSINQNMVTVRLKEGSGYSYSFFNSIPIVRYDLSRDGGLNLVLGESNE